MAATSVPACWVPPQSKASRLSSRPESSVLTRILQFRPAGSWCLCHHRSPTLLHCHGDRRHPAEAQCPKTLTGNRQLHVSLIKVNAVLLSSGRLFYPIRIFWRNFSTDLFCDRVKDSECEAGAPHRHPRQAPVPRGWAGNHQVILGGQSPAASPWQPLHLWSPRDRQDCLLQLCSPWNEGTIAAQIKLKKKKALTFPK